MNKTEYFVAAKICGFYELLIADNQKGANHSLFRKAPELIEQNTNFVQLERYKNQTETNRPDPMYYIVFIEKCKAAQGS